MKPVIYKNTFILKNWSKHSSISHATAPKKNKIGRFLLQSNVRAIFNVFVRIKGTFANKK